MPVSDAANPPPVSHASVRRSRRLSAMWLIPLAAIAIGGWLAWDTLSKEGPTITLSFETAEGLQAGQSQLKFKEIVLGTVKSLELTADHRHVLVKIATTRQAEPLLTDTTTFWVVSPRLFAGNLSGLGTLLSGAYVGMLPGEAAGKPRREFVGREDPPVLETNVPGHTFLLKAGQLGSISLGSPVFYRNLDVGTVLGWDIANMATSVTIHAFVRAPYDSYVHDETRFWDASGVSLKLGGAGVDVQVESLRAVLLGGVAFETPAGSTHVAISSEDHVFPLFKDRDTADAASYTRQIPLVSYFPGSVKGLASGSEVTIHGLMVGHVTDVRLAYDPATNTAVAPVHFEVQPERVVGIGKQVYKTQAEAVDALVKQGLRATLQSASLITGQQEVALDFVANAPPATVTMEGTNFVMPTTDSGGFSGLQASATELLTKVNTIPFDQIGKNLDGILSAANTAANGGQMRQSLTELAAVVARVKDLADHLDSGVSPALRQLPDIATGLQKTLTNTNRLVQSLDTGYGDNTQFNRDLGRLMVQLNEAMSSIRALADLLARDPEALIKGRPTAGVQ
jgi:paraquat-inducible protein B